MLERTAIPAAPWWIVEAVDKKKARLNCIHHLLGQIPYQEVPRPPIVLRPRTHHPDYQRHMSPMRTETALGRGLMRMLG